jgi:hypothetical protein
MEANIEILTVYHIAKAKASEAVLSIGSVVAEINATMKPPMKNTTGAPTVAPNLCTLTIVIVYVMLVQYSRVLPLQHREEPGPHKLNPILIWRLQLLGYQGCHLCPSGQRAELGLLIWFYRQ